MILELKVAPFPLDSAIMQQGAALPSRIKSIMSASSDDM